MNEVIKCQKLSLRFKKFNFSTINSQFHALAVKLQLKVAAILCDAMFSPDRYGVRRSSFSHPDDHARPFIGMKTAFRNTSGPSPKGKRATDSRTSLQQAAHMRFSEPATPSVLKERGLRPSDLGDPHKREFLTALTSRVFHLALVSTSNE